jgi:hypothetical protein
LYIPSSLRADHEHEEAKEDEAKPAQALREAVKRALLAALTLLFIINNFSNLVVFFISL